MEGKLMYICNNCGNREKFIGYAEEKGSATILQHINCRDENFFINEAPDYGMISASTPYKNINTASFKYKDFSWFYNISDCSWKGHLEIKRCYYCLSEDISAF
jgi:hypothetical protein